MKLSVTTNPYTVKNEINLINGLFDAGLDELHLRKPKLSQIEMKKFINEIDSDYHHRVVLHTHYTLVHHFDIHRIHLGHDWTSRFVTDMYLNMVILKNKKVSKSMTITSCEPLYKPVSGINEFLLGPIFAKFSYETDKQLIKTEVLEKALRHSKLNVSAMGGVSTETLGFFKNTGFGGVNVQSAIWKSADPVAAFSEIRDHYSAIRQTLRIAV